MKIYISGKITGLPLKTAKANFAETEKMLREKGFTDIVNPITLCSHAPLTTWEECMIKDLEALFSCQAIYLQRDWIESRGARIEYHIAKELGLKILFEDEVPF